MSAIHRRPAIFLDKDGTLIEDVPYSVDPHQIRLTAGAGESLQRLQQAGYLLIVISNQAGVAHGYFPETALMAVEQEICSQLMQWNVSLTGFYYCPHHPDGTVSDYAIACQCRKPSPGLVLKAAQDYLINLSCSWFVGDILNDVEAGHRAGCQTILIDNGNETEWQLSPQRLPDYILADLVAAADIIMTVDQAIAASSYPAHGSSHL